MPAIWLFRQRMRSQLVVWPGSQAKRSAGKSRCTMGADSSVIWYASEAGLQYCGGRSATQRVVARVCCVVSKQSLKIMTFRMTLLSKSKAVPLTSNARPNTSRYIQERMRMALDHDVQSWESIFAQLCQAMDMSGEATSPSNTRRAGTMEVHPESMRKALCYHERRQKSISVQLYQAMNTFGQQAGPAANLMLRNASKGLLESPRSCCWSQVFQRQDLSAGPGDRSKARRHSP
ncbi:hypothetical protein LTR15_011444 [Elasticomyces elasticus]|nr:hypothetical protein LTR15_011444 [Elasticomyces elasticus]